MRLPSIIARICCPRYSCYCYCLHVACALIAARDFGFAGPKLTVVHMMDFRVCVLWFVAGGGGGGGGGLLLLLCSKLPPPTVSRGLHACTRFRGRRGCGSGSLYSSIRTPLQRGNTAVVKARNHHDTKHQSHNHNARIQDDKVEYPVSHPVLDQKSRRARPMRVRSVTLICQPAFHVCCSLKFKLQIAA